MKIKQNQRKNNESKEINENHRESTEIKKSNEINENHRETHENNRKAMK